MSSDKRYMITLVGQDRPGIVAALTSVLFDAGISLGEASMMRLGDNFAVMVAVEVDQDPAQLRQLLAPVATQLDLRLHVDPCRGRSRDQAVPDIRISVFGADRSGIVAQVTSALAETGFNILDLESDIAGTDTEPVYVLHIEGQAADGIEAIEAALEAVSRQGVSIEVSPVELMIG